MTNRERTLACLNYGKYDRLPVVHFGYWGQTLEKWSHEGHVTPEEAANWTDGNETDHIVSGRLGFDFGWTCASTANTGLMPPFESKIVEEMPDGSRKRLNADGMIVLERDGATSIPAEIDHLLKDRAAWEEHYLPRLQFSAERVALAPNNSNSEIHGLHCGSLLGAIRNWIGVEGLSYLQVDDPALFEEIVDTVGDLAYESVSNALQSGRKFDFGHFWEDICFKSGPLINPRVFAEKVGPHYKRISALLRDHGTKIVSLDCDGKIDALIPVWLENGVNTMFPIEVGTWGASIAPWREQYGTEVRGVGGVNKTVFAKDRAAVDAEIERLKPLVELGGFIPCPDHRIAPDAEWELVRHYCDRMREVSAS